jgi:hypothetical protein
VADPYIGHIPIPFEVIDVITASRRLTSIQKLLLIRIYLSDRGPDGCYAKPALMAGRIGRSVDRMEEVRRELLELGVVTRREGRGRRTDSWFVVFPLDCAPLSRKDEDVERAARTFDAWLAGEPQGHAGHRRQSVPAAVEAVRIPPKHRQDDSKGADLTASNPRSPLNAKAILRRGVGSTRVSGGEATTSNECSGKSKDINENSGHRLPDKEKSRNQFAALKDALAVRMAITSPADAGGRRGNREKLRTAMEVGEVVGIAGRPDHVEDKPPAEGRE